MSTIRIHIWPCDDCCEPEDLDEYLSFHSDDYITVDVEITTYEDVPTYNQALELLK